ncbi:MAG: hypothetical protein V8S24_10675 [Gordonibacter pamelaeae]
MPSSAFADDDENLVNPQQRPDSSFIYDTSIAALGNADAYYDNQTVQVVGEVIGDSIREGLDNRHRWITLAANEKDFHCHGVRVHDRRAGGEDRHLRQVRHHRHEAPGARHVPSGVHRARGAYGPARRHRDRGGEGQAPRRRVRRERVRSRRHCHGARGSRSWACCYHLRERQR